jgi:hypothetical protein
MIEIVEKYTGLDINGDGLEQQHAQEWLDLLLKYSKAAREKKTNLIMREEHGHSSVALFRAKCKRVFWSPFVQMLSAFLVVGGFVMDISEAQLLPVEGSNQENIYFICDVKITALFVLELLLNIFAHSANNFVEFYTRGANWFDVFIIVAQLLSLIVSATGGAKIP